MKKQKNKKEKKIKPLTGELTEKLAEGSQSEKISYLLAEIGTLTIQLQNLDKEKWEIGRKLIDQENNHYKFKLDVVKYIMGEGS